MSCSHTADTSHLPLQISAVWDSFPLMPRKSSLLSNPSRSLKGNYPKQLKFEVADATCLPYENNSFDVVIIANALHVMPEPQKALKEIDRVLKDGGLLIAPNFVGHKKGVISRIWSGILKIAGIRFEHQWTSEEYFRWLEFHGWRVRFSKELGARIPLVYTECVRK